MVCSLLTFPVGFQFVFDNNDNNNLICDVRRRWIEAIHLV